MRNTRAAFDSVFAEPPVDRMRCDLPLAAQSAQAFASLTQHYVDRIACTPCVQAHVSAVTDADQFDPNNDTGNRSWRAPTIGAWALDQNALTLPLAGCTDELGSIHPDLYVWVRGLAVWTQNTPPPALPAIIGALESEQTYSTAPGADSVSIPIGPAASVASIRVQTFNPSDYVPILAGAGAFATAAADLIPYEQAQAEVQVSRRVPWQSRVPGAVNADPEPRVCTATITGTLVGTGDCILYCRSVAIVHTRGR